MLFVVFDELVNYEFQFLNSYDFGEDTDVVLVPKEFEALDDES